MEEINNSKDHAEKGLGVSWEKGNKEGDAQACHERRAHNVLAKSHQMPEDRSEYGNRSLNIGLGDSELEEGACRIIQPRLHRTTRDINQGIFNEEFDGHSNDAVELGAEEQKREPCCVPAQLYDVKHGGNRLLAATLPESQAGFNYEDYDYDYEASRNPNEQSLTTADMIRGKNLFLRLKSREKELYATRNDPRPQMIPKLDLNTTRNDPRPQMIPKLFHTRPEMIPEEL